MDSESDINSPVLTEMTPKEVLTPEQRQKYSKIAIATMTGEDLGQVQSTDIEEALLKGVHGLPEELAKKMGTVDPEAYLKRADELKAEIAAEFAKKDRNLEDLTSKQVDLIYQYLAIIGKVQGHGDSGFLPSIAREIDEQRDKKEFGLDCSLSAWALKEKLQDVPGMVVDFGYIPGHAVDIMTVADGSTLYVDAQNGFVAKVETEEVVDENVPDMDYPIFHVTNAEKLVGHLPEGDVAQTRPNGVSYVFPYWGRKSDGLGITLGNLFMLNDSNKGSTVNQTSVAKNFQRMLPEVEFWGDFRQKFLQGEVTKGKTIYDTKYYQMVEKDREKHRKSMAA